MIESIYRICSRFLFVLTDFKKLPHQPLEKNCSQCISWGVLSLRRSHSLLLGSVEPRNWKSEYSSDIIKSNKRQISKSNISETAANFEK